MLLVRCHQLLNAEVEVEAEVAHSVGIGGASRIRNPNPELPLATPYPNCTYEVECHELIAHQALLHDI